MTRDAILAELKSARDRLTAAIAALEGTAPRRGRAKRHMSAEARRRVSEGMRKSWAAVGKSSRSARE
jgi:hypothetical protein